MGRILTTDDVEAAIRGGSVFAAGGSWAHHGRMVGTAAVNAGEPKLGSIDEAPDDAFIAGHMGLIGMHGKDGSWYLTRLKPYRTVEDKIDGVVVTFVDIGERRRAEDAMRESESRMRIMVGELQHRTRNLIGEVMALVDQTRTAGQTLDEFKASLRDRLRALARVQGLLSRAAPGEGVTFDSFLDSELSAQSENGGIVTRDGPVGIALNSTSVQALAMALHELTTNAVKYGALGQKNGRLAVRWRVQTENGAPWINVEWKEGGVETPPSAEGRREGGSGRRLIEDALPYQFGARTTFASRTGRRPLHDRASALRTSVRGDPRWTVRRFVTAASSSSRTST